MSGLSPRWKEKRMQEEIYKQSFKYVKDSSNGLSPHGSNGTTIALDHQTPGAVGIGNQNWRGDHAVAPRNHAAARALARNANRGDQPRNRRRRRILVIGAVIGVLGLFFGVRYWMYASTHEDTDDAYVTGYTHQISSRITGTVEEVLVDDNWHVTAGQPLLKLDPRDYQVQLQKDRASYLQAQAQLLQATAQIPLAEAQLAQAQAQADSTKANSDYLHSHESQVWRTAISNR